MDDDTAKRISKEIDMDDFVENADDLIEALDDLGDQYYYDAIGNTLEEMKILKAPSKNLYKTTLFKGKDPSEYKFVDWYDEPPPKTIDKINQQLKKEGRGEVVTREGLESLIKSGVGVSQSMPDMSFKQYYKGLSKKFGSDKDASDFLKRAGIDGIRYPTESLSGVKNSDKYNYVIFDESAIHIEDIKRY